MTYKAMEREKDMNKQKLIHTAYNLRHQAKTTLLDVLIIASLGVFIGWVIFKTTGA